MAKKKNGKKRSSKSLLKNRKFLFGVAIVLAIVVVAGFASFAGSANRGRVFSWKQKKVLYEYQVRTGNPDAQTYQQLVYSDADDKTWGNRYLSVYTEKTAPALGSRAIEAKSSGEDVLALKAALSRIGEHYVFPKVDKGFDSKPVQLKSAYKEFSSIQLTDKRMDGNTLDIIKNVLGGGLYSNYTKYWADSKLDKYELARIFTLATDPTFNIGIQGVMVFDINVNSGRIYNNGVVVKQSDPKVSGFEMYYSSFKGQTDSLRTGEKQASYYPISAVLVNKGTPNLYSGMEVNKAKGANVRILQTMLNYVKRIHPNDFTYDKLPVNGNMDYATLSAVNKFEAFYGLPNSNRTVRYRTLSELVNNLTWMVYTK